MTTPKKPRTVDSVSPAATAEWISHSLGDDLKKVVRDLFPFRQEEVLRSIQEVLELFLVDRLVPSMLPTNKEEQEDAKQIIAAASELQKRLQRFPPRIDAHAATEAKRIGADWLTLKSGMGKDIVTLITVVALAQQKHSGRAYPSRKIVEAEKEAKKKLKSRLIKIFDEAAKKSNPIPGHARVRQRFLEAALSDLDP